VKDKDDPKTFKEAFKEDIYQSKVVLKLYIHTANKFMVEREVVIKKASEAIISFSPDGRYFAIFMPKINNLDVYEVGEVGCMIHFITEYEGGLEPIVRLSQLEDLKGMRKLLWNRGSESEYLCLFNNNKLRIVDIKKNLVISEKHRFDIEEKENLSMILQATVFLRGEKLSCLVACLDRDRQYVKV
jgi:hypothetical protein